MDLIADLINRVLASPDDDGALAMVKQEVERLCRRFPLYADRR
jgi:glycine/serine hydroxymethyltransferase